MKSVTGSGLAIVVALSLGGCVSLPEQQGKAQEMGVQEQIRKIEEAGRQQEQQMRAVLGGYKVRRTTFSQYESDKTAGGWKEFGSARRLWKGLWEDVLPHVSHAVIRLERTVGTEFRAVCSLEFESCYGGDSEYLNSLRDRGFLHETNIMSIRPYGWTEFVLTSIRLLP